MNGIRGFILSKYTSKIAMFVLTGRRERKKEKGSTLGFAAYWTMKGEFSLSSLSGLISKCQMLQVHYIYIGSGSTQSLIPDGGEWQRE